MLMDLDPTTQTWDGAEFCFLNKVLDDMFNKAIVTGTVLQTLLYSFIHSIIQWAMLFLNTSKCLHSKTVKARELKFKDNVHLPPCVICQVTLVTCPMSQVTQKKLWYMYLYKKKIMFLIFLVKVVELVGGRFVINRAYPF